MTTVSDETIHVRKITGRLNWGSLQRLCREEVMGECGLVPELGQGESCEVEVTSEVGSRENTRVLVRLHLHPDHEQVGVPCVGTTQTAGVLREVAEERGRQLAKGHTPGHDDGHTEGEISRQAAASISDKFVSFAGAGVTENWVRSSHKDWGNQTTFAQERRRELIQGIALAVAEVERLDRVATPPSRSAGSWGPEA